MAWDVVISGGGFGGLYAARTLERTMPRQSARITLVNDVNFLLYTPFLPEAAAGMLEPRHVVTPLRDVLDADAPAPGRRDRARPGPAHGHAARPGGRRARAALRPPGGRARLGVAGAARSPGSSEHAIGFKSLADAIWLRNHVIQSLEMADATDDPERRRGAADVRRSWAAATPASRRWPSCRTSPPRRSSRIPARACTGCAGSWSRRWTACCPRSTLALADYALRAAARAGHRHPPRDDARGGHRHLGADLHRRDGRHAHRRLDRRRRRPSQRPQPRPAARRARSHRGRRLPARRSGEDDVWALGDAPPSPTPRKPGRALPADLAARDPAGKDGRPQRGGLAGRRGAGALHVQDARGSS